MENNYIIDLELRYKPTNEEFGMLMDCITCVSERQVILSWLVNKYPKPQFACYRGNEIVLFSYGFFAHVYKDEVSGYTICKITDNKQAVHIDIEKSVAFMLSDAINRTKDVFSFDTKITRQSHPYLPPNSNE